MVMLRGREDNSANWLREGDTMSALLEVALFLGLGRLLVSFGRLPRDTSAVLTSWVCMWPGRRRRCKARDRCGWTALFWGGWRGSGACSPLRWWPSRLRSWLSDCAGLRRARSCSRAARAAPPALRCPSSSGIAARIALRRPSCSRCSVARSRSACSAWAPAASCRRAGRPGLIARRITTFPPLLALVVGLMLPRSALPQFAQMAVHDLAVTLAPLAIVAVGMHLRGLPDRTRLAPIAAALSFKLVLAPAAVLLGFEFFGPALGNSGKLWRCWPRCRR